MTRESRALTISAVFIATIPTAVLLSAKITEVFGLTFTVGAYAYAVTFPCTDIIGDCFGKKRAKQLVWLGFIGYVVTVLFTLLALVSPPAAFWATNADAYNKTLGLVPRIVVASVLAYLASQLHDVWAFHFWKQLTAGRHLWLRNNLSTMTSQFVDTAIFVTVAFVGVVPSSAFFKMLVGQYVIKLLISAIDTPIVYLGVRWIQSPFSHDTEDTVQVTDISNGG